MSPIERTTLTPLVAISVRATVPMAELQSFFADGFRALGEAVEASHAQCIGAPFARYHSMPPGPLDVELVMPVSKPVQALGRVKPVEIGGGPAVQLMHVGPYDTMRPTYEALNAWMASNGLEPAGPVREVYLSDPAHEPDPAHWQTLVVQPTRVARAEKRV
jgi:effector-binding domain-containing protein